MNPHKMLCTLSASLLTLTLFTQAQDKPTTTKSDDSKAVVVVSKDAKENAVVSMSFDETPISDVIRAFRDATGANIISSGTNLSQTVSVRLDNVPWEKGLSSILDPQGLQLLEKPVGSGIYIVEEITIEIPVITKTFQLNNAQVTDVQELFASVLGDKGKATAFPSSNTLIVTAPEKEINECEMIIEAIDAPSQQVYIEARFVEMSAEAGKSLGIRWDSLGGDGWGMTFDGATLGYRNDRFKTVNKSNVGETTRDTDDGAGNTSSTTLPYVPAYSTSDTTYERDRTFTGSLSMDAFRLAMNAFESTEGVSIFSNPKVIVANEQKAKIDMTTKEPNVEVDYQAATTDGQRDSVSTKLGIIPGEEEPFVGEAFFSYGITLNVKPRINSAGLVTVTIEPSISSLVGYFNVQGLDPDMPVGKFPIIDMRRIQTVFTLESGRTAVIGGLSKTTDRSQDSGIPFLKKIPWIGPRLFGWKSRRKDQKEIVIFVTVKIVDPTTIEEDEGMPRNAILSREVITGERKEPSEMTRADLFDLNDKSNIPDTSFLKKMDKKVTEKEAAEKADETVVIDAKPVPAEKKAPAAVKDPEPILAN